MTFHQSLGDLLSIQGLDGDGDDRSISSEPERPASTPPYLRHRTATQQELNLDEQVVPSLRSQDLVGRIRSYEGLLWRKRGTKVGTKNWTERWFRVAPGTLHACSMVMFVSLLEYFAGLRGFCNYYCGCNSGIFMVKVCRGMHVVSTGDVCQPQTCTCRYIVDPHTQTHTHTNEKMPFMGSVRSSISLNGNNNSSLRKAAVHKHRDGMCCTISPTVHLLTTMLYTEH